jgi:hypothetical protein
MTDMILSVGMMTSRKTLEAEDTALAFRAEIITLDSDH